MHELILFRYEKLLTHGKWKYEQPELSNLPQEVIDDMVFPDDIKRYVVRCWRLFFFFFAALIFPNLYIPRKRRNALL